MRTAFIILVVSVSLWIGAQSVSTLGEAVNSHRVVKAEMIDRITN